MEYFTVKQEDTAQSILKRLDKLYGLNNLYPYSAPLSLMGSAKILEVRVINKRQSIKIDGPGQIVNDIYKELVSK